MIRNSRLQISFRRKIQMTTGRVNIPSLNVRDQPDGQVIGVLALGATVDTISTDDSGKWLFMTAEIDGVTRLGWVSEPFIDLVDGGLDVPSAPSGPRPSADTGIFGQDNWKAYKDVLGNRESGNDYGTINQFGFCGRWQFGAGALADCGYVRKGSRNSDLKSTGVWLGVEGVSSLTDWLSDHDAQDSAMLTYTKGHYNSLLKAGGLQPDSSLARCAGLLAAAHLLGVGGAMSFVRGAIGHDANGVTSAQHYSLLSKAFGGSGVLEA
jgi:hypothetical protein